MKSWRIADPGVYLHVDPKGPDVQRVDGLPEPVRQVHVIKTAPGPRQQASGEGAVQRHLQEQTQTSTWNHENLGLEVKYITVSFILGVEYIDCIIHSTLSVRRKHIKAWIWKDSFP